MDIEIYSEYENQCSRMVNELYSIYEGFGNIKIKAYFKTVNREKIYYDFQSLDTTKLKGSYDKLEVLELIHYLEI